MYEYTTSEHEVKASENVVVNSLILSIGIKAIFFY